MKRKKINKQVKITLKNIQLIVYDFDGVMTDNKVITFYDGSEAVMVNRSDGLAIFMLKKNGMPQLIITTESNEVVAKRAEKLKIPILDNVSNKKEALVRYCRRNGYDLKRTVFIGNDINDLEVMKEVGIPVCPANAHKKIKKISKYILTKRGGEGVIREFIDLLRNI